MKKLIFIIIAISLSTFIKAKPISRLESDSLKTNCNLLDVYREMSLKHNYNLKAAQKNIAASIELEKAAKADTKPTLDAGADFSYVGNPLELNIDIPALGAPITFNGKNINYGANISIVQPIYTGGKLLESIRLAQNKSAFAKWNEESIHNGVCFQTDIQYWNTVAKFEILNISTQYYESVKAFCKTISERVKAGLVDPQDLLMAQVKLNEAEHNLSIASSNYKTGLLALNSLVGIELENNSDIDKEIPIILSSAEILEANDNSNLPEIKMAESNLNIAQTSLKLNDSKYKPKLYVGAQGSYSSPGYNFKSDLDPNYGVYAKLSIPIIQWGKRGHEKRAYSNMVEIGDYKLQDTKEAIRLEIESYKISLSESIERIKLSQNSLSIAKENEKKTLDRYNLGECSIIEAIEAQIYRLNSETNLVRAKLNAQANYSSLLRILNLYK